MPSNAVVTTAVLFCANGVNGWGKISALATRSSALMESLRSIPPPNLTQFEDRTSCSCCCCGDVVSNRTFINTGSDQLEHVLEQHGVIGCHGMAGLVDRNSIETVFPGRKYPITYKQHVHKVTHATLRDGRDVVIFDTDNAWQLGVGSMILSRKSPFTVDL